MRKLFVGLLLLIASTAQAQSTDRVWQMFAHESITVSTVSKSLTSSVHSPTNADGTASSKQAEYATITVETDSVRIYFDGTAADGSGHLILSGSVVNLYGSNQIRNFRAIRVTNDATIRVSYGR